MQGVTGVKWVNLLDIFGGGRGDVSRPAHDSLFSVAEAYKRLQTCGANRLIRLCSGAGMCCEGR